MSNTSEQTRICEICADDFKGKGEKKEVICEGCERGVCVACCKTFILDATQPACMYPDCGLGWSRQFMVANFPISFITGPLKKQREDVFFDREKALLPATQVTVNNIIREEKRDAIHTKYNKLRKVVDKTYFDEYEYITTNLCMDKGGYILLRPRGIAEDDSFTQFALESGVEPLHLYGEEKGRRLSSLFTNNTSLHRVRTALRVAFVCNNKNRKYSQSWANLCWNDGVLNDQLILAALVVYGGGKFLVPYTAKWRKHNAHHYAIIIRTRGSATTVIFRDQIDELERNGLRRQVEDTVASERRFIRGCPKEDCKGYLSSGWKCGLCEEHVCSKCHIPIGIKMDDEHICDEDVAATAQLIASESKPCPGCKINIYKIDGCNQMWCTQCKTPWDWKSGRIETKVHNPHYFEYLRSRGQGGGAQRNPNEVRCGREINAEFAVAFGFILRRHDFPIEEIARVHDIARGLVHFDGHFINGALGDAPDAELLRICYMRGMIDEKVFKRRVQMTYKKFHKEKELQEVFVMFKQTVTDILYRYRDELDTSETKEEAMTYVSTLDEVGHLEQYVNVCLKNIAVAYQSTPMEVTLTVKELPSKVLAYGLYNPKTKRNSNGARAASLVE
jgi:hypothetical protein